MPINHNKSLPTPLMNPPESAIDNKNNNTNFSTSMMNNSMDKYHDDDALSIDASDEDASSQDSHGLLRGSKDGSHRSGSGAGGSGSGGAKAPIDLVKKETYYVNVLRYTIVLLVIATAIFVGVGTWFWVSEATGDNNKDQKTSVCYTREEDFDFGSFVAAVNASLTDAWVSHLSAAFTLSASATSSALLQQSSGTWPQVTIPHFVPQTTGILQTLGGTTNRIIFAPLVRSFDRNDFESFARTATQELMPVSEIYNVNDTSLQLDANVETILSPVLQTSPTFLPPPQEESFLLVDLFSDALQGPALRKMIETKAAVFSTILDEVLTEDGQALLFDSSSIFSTPRNQVLDATTSPGPTTTLFYPILEAFQQPTSSSSGSSGSTVVGSLSMNLGWRPILEKSIPPFSFLGATMVVEQSCQPGLQLGFTVLDAKGTVEYMGPVDIDDETLELEEWEEQMITLPSMYEYGVFDQGMMMTTTTNDDTNCEFRVRIFPDSTFVPTIAALRTVDDDEGSKPVVYTALVALLYFAILIVFLTYDWLVERRQSVVINIATKSSAIVENLFPAQVRDRMLQNITEKAAAEKAEDKATAASPTNQTGDGTPTGPTSTTTGGKPAAADTAVSVKQFLTNMPENYNDLSSQPIADLFPNTTVLFADIAGFTAWSSQREPPQVFTLLETLYRSFDVIAGKLKVFKVETIGDCYMAVTGLPNPDDQHAVHMSRFAYQCLMGMKELIKELEAVLGPGTSDLALRVGLHSGPVTAGVLRGEKSRFQLFGDTVNTASRMESTGERSRIQVSQETGDLLMAAGKSHWLKPREGTIVAKGKGELKTYWLDPTKKRTKAKNGGKLEIRVTQEIALTNGDYVDKPMSPAEASFDEKYARLIDWNVDVLLHHLARVISSRSRTPSKGSLVNHSSEVALLPLPVNDVAEVVALPPFDSDSSRFRRARPDVSMLQQTREDLHEYVKRIAMMYRDVPFHNFEHASHVTLCANKLLNRLINSDEYETEEELHNSTFGISSDPLTHFAIVFAALIHDVDHTGLPNAQLIKDEDDIAVKFDNKSVAEQNSVHLGWEMLMDPRFERLRKCVYQTNVERKRFRQLVINSVMATDIADRQVNQERQNKWDKAFRRNMSEEATPLQVQDDMNRKATAVIEHIIQVSDVAHTMQHWHIYRRWNERLFHEMHNSYQTSRTVVDPSTNWYIGELGFFDYYLIPLAMKLKECGVFGASGYEYISYVLKNKKEWERKGRQVVQEMVLLYKDSEETDDEDDETTDSEMDSDDLGYDSTGELSESDVSDDPDEIDSMNPVHED